MFPNWLTLRLEPVLFPITHLMATAPARQGKKRHLDNVPRDISRLTHFGGAKLGVTSFIPETSNDAQTE
jgi:hypothetical protein